MRQIATVMAGLALVGGASKPRPPLGRPRVAAAPRAPVITIGVIGDQTGASDLDASYRVLARGVEALNAWPGPLDVVIHTGDLIESTASEAEIRRRFHQVTGILDGLSTAWWAAAGDHDVNPPGFQQDSGDRSREALFQQLYAAVNPKVEDHLYYSFDLGGYHFIALYSGEHLHTDPRWGNVFYSQLTDAQYRWLEGDLAAAADSSGVVVFLHQPLWYNWSSWARVHELLSRYPVAVVVAGHFHYNQSDEVIDGIRYWVVGATGGSTKTGNPNSGDLQHVTIISLSGRQATLRLVPIVPFPATDWTPRYYMDRLQAVDQTFGNLWNFAQGSPVFLDGRRLVRKCGEEEPAQLVLADFGNAAELPVRISIDVDGGPSIRVTKGEFAANACASDIGPLSCVLAPSAGVAVSNTSIVQTLQGAPPLWRGTLGVSGSAPAVGTPIAVTVRMSFDANRQTYSLQTEVSTTVQGCVN